MEPKSDSNPFSKPITVYWTHNGWQSNQNLDPATAAWVQKFLEDFLSQDDVWDFDSVSDVNSELRDLEAQDDQVQGEHLPDTLSMIMSAVQRVRDRG
jgi:hypothetical protein